jgi:transposase
VPSNRNNKTQIIDWLNNNNILFPENALKVELLNLVKLHSPPKSYSVDEIIRNAGHIPLRLPPYHCDFNPIEMVWSQMKNYITTHNIDNNVQQCKTLIEESMKIITLDNWNNYVNHCEKLENDYWESDGIIESNIENFVIDFRDDSDTDSDSDISFSDYLLEYNNDINCIDHNYY